MIARITLLLGIAIGWQFNCQAQLQSTNNLIRPSLFYTFNYESPGAISDTAGPVADSTSKFRFAQTGISANVPLFSVIQLKDDQVIPNLYYLSVLVKTGYAKTSLFGKQYDHDLTNLLTGFTGTYLNLQKRKTLFLYVGGFAYEDVRVLHTPTIRFSALGYYAKQYRNWGFYTGASYSYIFGQELPILLFGFNGKITRTTKFQTTMPMSLSFFIPVPISMYVEQRIKQKWRVRLLYELNGGLYGISNEDNIYPIFDDEVLLRKRALLTGLRLTWEPADGYRFYTEGGFANFRSVSFTSTSPVGLDIIPLWDVAAGNYLEAGIRIKIGKKKSGYTNVEKGMKVNWDSINWDELDLDDIDLDDIDVEDLEEEE